MKPEFIEALSKKSAYKYYNTSHHEDLISEGILAAYEELNTNPEVTEQRMYQVINWAQWKFLNVDCLAVTMPEKLVRIVKGLGKNNENSGWTDEDNIGWASIILSQGQFNSAYHDVDTESDQAQEYSDADLLDSIWESAQECLTEEEYKMFRLHFDAGLDGKTIGDMKGVSKQAVHKTLKAINEKVRKHVVNKKWEV
jgi:RNA polymerase sigma factor (sigma-70 family)